MLLIMFVGYFVSNHDLTLSLMEDYLGHNNEGI